MKIKPRKPLGRIILKGLGLPAIYTTGSYYEQTIDYSITDQCIMDTLLFNKLLQRKERGIINSMANTVMIPNYSIIIAILQ